MLIGTYKRSHNRYSIVILLFIFLNRHFTNNLVACINRSQKLKIHRPREDIIIALDLCRQCRGQQSLDDKSALLIRSRMVSAFIS